MKVYVILESFTDYKGGNATSFGVFKTRESAISALPQAVVDRFGYTDVAEWENEYDDKFDRYFCNSDKSYWCRDTGDDITEFYIQADEMED